jgi:hypothetical protein
MIAERESSSGGISFFLILVGLVLGGLMLVPLLSNLPMDSSMVYAKNPNSLPSLPEVWPNHIPVPPSHVQNHPRGEYTSRLKVLGWLTVFQLWQSGKPPDWCGERLEDGALIMFYNVSVGKYKGVAAIFNTGGGNSSTVLAGIKWNGRGIPHSNNSSGNDFEQFQFIPPDRCPPPPLNIVQ